LSWGASLLRTHRQRPCALGWCWQADFWQNLAMRGSLPQESKPKEKVEPSQPVTKDSARAGLDRAPLAVEPGNRTGGPAARIERGGPKGPEPTRFGDWERAGRCIDF
jgi:hypothetical protein